MRQVYQETEDMPQPGSKKAHQQAAERGGSRASVYARRGSGQKGSPTLDVGGGDPAAASFTAGSTQTESPKTNAEDTAIPPLVRNAARVDQCVRSLLFSYCSTALILFNVGLMMLEHYPMTQS